MKKLVVKFMGSLLAGAVAGLIFVTPVFADAVSDANAQLQDAQKAHNAAIAADVNAQVEASNAAKVAQQEAAKAATEAYAEQVKANNAKIAEDNAAAVAANLLSKMPK